MPISRQSLSETLSDDLASLHKARAALSNAWALRMSASLKAHFAAVLPLYSHVYSRPQLISY